MDAVNGMHSAAKGRLDTKAIVVTTQLQLKFAFVLQPTVRLDSSPASDLCQPQPSYPVNNTTKTRQLHTEGPGYAWPDSQREYEQVLTS
jgi:hypothetical protein